MCQTRIGSSSVYLIRDTTAVCLSHGTPQLCVSATEHHSWITFCTTLTILVERRCQSHSFVKITVERYNIDATCMLITVERCNIAATCMLNNKSRMRTQMMPSLVQSSHALWTDTSLWRDLQRQGSHQLSSMINRCELLIRMHNQADEQINEPFTRYWRFTSVAHYLKLESRQREESYGDKIIRFVNEDCWYKGIQERVRCFENLNDHVVLSFLKNAG